MTTQLPMTGERFIPGMSGIIELEHMHRYVFALDLARGKRVLDLACGAGYGSNLLASVAEYVLGIDISTESVAFAKNRYVQKNLLFRVADCADLPLEENSFDLVVSFETIEHHDRHDEMLSEIRRVLKPDGLLLISSPNKLLYSDLPGSHNQYHVKELYFNELESLLYRFFPNVKFYGQRAVPTSLIVPMFSHENIFSQFKLINDNVVNNAVLDNPVYYLAVASCSPVLPCFGFSIYENVELVEKHQSTSISVPMFEVRMFWRSEWTDVCDGYSEGRSSAVMIDPSERPQHIRLAFSEDCSPVKRVRVDILNSIGAVDIHSMSIVTQDNQVIWRWNGDTKVFQNIVQALIIPDHHDANICTFFTLGNDPWFELSLEDTLYQKIKPGCALILVVSAYNLLDRLPSVVDKLLKIILSSQKHTPNSPVVFAESIDSLAVLVDKALAVRDKLIREQRSQLMQIQDELTRAEAQLDLLKDLLLD